MAFTAHLKKIAVVIFWLLLVAYSLWLVVSNQQPTSLNLLFIEISSMNTGLIVVLSFVLGCLLGVLAAIFVWQVIPLRWQLRQSQKELALLRKQYIKPPVEAASTKN